MLAGGRARWGFLVALAVALAGGCGLSGDPLADPGPSTTERDDPSDASDDETTTTRTDRLSTQEYDVGDCVTWDLTAAGSVEGQSTRVVPCTQPHRIQMSAKDSFPDQALYPSDLQWDAFYKDVCGAHASVLLGGPLDPYGRLNPTAMRPTPDGWSVGDRAVWCGLSLKRADGVMELTTEDMRGADQWDRFEVGQCVVYPPEAPAREVVPCTQPHHIEVTGRVDYTDQVQPAAGEADPRCTGLGEAYVGGPAPAPWAYGGEGVAPESWAAGRRFAHCFVAQWNPDGTNAVVSVSVRG